MANRHRIALDLGTAGGERRHRNRKAIEIERRDCYHDLSQLKAWAAGCPHAAHQAAAIGAGGKGIVKSVRRGLAVHRGRRAVAGPLASLGFKQIPSPCEVEAALALGEEAAVTNANANATESRRVPSRRHRPSAAWLR
jgi:hypothetical protein